MSSVSLEIESPTAKEILYDDHYFLISCLFIQFFAVFDIGIQDRYFYATSAMMAIFVNCCSRQKTLSPYHFLVSLLLLFTVPLLVFLSLFENTKLIVRLISANCYRKGMGMHICYMLYMHTERK